MIGNKILTTHINNPMISTYDPDDEEFDSDSRYEVLQEIHEELADYNESFAQSEEGGWFYSDDD